MDECTVSRRELLGAFGTVGALTFGARNTLGQETTESGSSGGGAGGGSGRPPDYGGWLDDVDNYDGETVDMRGQTRVTVTVAASGNSGNFAFDPPAVHVDLGATVVWEWTGKGGAHNVVAQNGAFSSGSVTQEGRFEYTFEEEGIYPYYCAPHRALGMKGAIVVGSDYPQKSPTQTPTPRESTVQGSWLGEGASGDWPTFSYDAANTGARPDGTGPEKSVEQAGVFGAVDHVGGSVVLHGQRLYVPTGDGLHAVDVRNGDSERWLPNTALHTTPTVADADATPIDVPVVYVGRDEYDDDRDTRVGRLYALDATTGRELWHREIDAGIYTCSALVGGRLYCGTSDGITAFDGATGDVDWQRTIPALAEMDDDTADITSTPAVADGTVYVGGGDYSVRAFDAATGDQQWSDRTEYFVDSSPAVVDGTVYVGSSHNAVLALDAATGDREWVAETESGVSSSPAVAGGTVYVGCNDFAIYAFDAASGERQWRTEFRAPVSSPAVVGNTVYAALTTAKARYPKEERAVVAVEANTGETRWRVPLPDEDVPAGPPEGYDSGVSGLASTPVVTDSALLVSDGKWGVFALQSEAAAQSGGDSGVTATATPAPTGDQAGDGSTAQPTESQPATTPGSSGPLVGPYVATAGTAAVGALYRAYRHLGE